MFAHCITSYGSLKKSHTQGNTNRQHRHKNRQNQPRANSSDVLHLAGRTTPSLAQHVADAPMQPAVSHIPPAPRTHANVCALTYIYYDRPCGFAVVVAVMVTLARVHFA